MAMQCLSFPSWQLQSSCSRKEGAGLFGKQGAGLLQQQQANSPKIPAVKVNVLSVLCNTFWLLTVVIHTQFSLRTHIVQLCNVCIVVLQSK